MKRREPAKIAVTIPTTSSQPALVLSRSLTTSTITEPIPAGSARTMLSVTSVSVPGAMFLRIIAGNGENEDEQWERSQRGSYTPTGQRG